MIPDSKMERLVEQGATAVFPPSFCPTLKKGRLSQRAAEK